MKFPALDISKYTTLEELNKLQEEVQEFKVALLLDDEDNMLEEALDVIQVLINILNRYELTDYLEEALFIHKKKLMSRGWKLDKFIEL